MTNPRRSKHIKVAKLDDKGKASKKHGGRPIDDPNGADIARKPASAGRKRKSAEVSETETSPQQAAQQHNDLLADLAVQVANLTEKLASASSRITDLENRDATHAELISVLRLARLRKSSDPVLAEMKQKHNEAMDELMNTKKLYF